MKKIPVSLIVLLYSFLACTSNLFCGCQKPSDNLPVKERKGNGNLPAAVFIYELHIYDSNGRESTYVKTSGQPLMGLDSSGFLEESLQDSRKISDRLYNRF